MKGYPATQGRQGLLLVLLVSLACTSQAVEIERPKIQVVDQMGVNMTSGQVTHSLTPVGIGGAAGLSYSISVFANEANWGGAHGFTSNYDGEAKAVLLSNDGGYSPVYIMRVNDDTGSADFKVLVNGVVVDFIASTPPPFTYVAIGDQRHSLVVNGTSLEWTKPDGTLVRFSHSGTTAGSGGIMTQIVRPNGYTISVGGDGLTSNRGFQLKPTLVPDNRPMEKTDNLNIINTQPASSSAGSGWSSLNPKYMTALNNAFEYCVPAPVTCSPSQSWPTATFDWPPGMPRTMFIGDSVVTVTDATGATTQFRHHAYDLAYDKNGQVPAGFVPGTMFSPRLVGIKTAGSTQETFTYDYYNLFNMQSGGWGRTWNTRAQDAGVTKSATHIGQTVNYTMLAPQFGGQDFRNNATTGGGVGAVYVHPKLIQGNTDLVEYADTREGRITFEVNNARNFPSLFTKVSGPAERYTYDTRGNLTKVEYLIDGAYVKFTEAHFPASCTPSTLKFCNQADWIADAKGNTTNYTYHPESGQVATITSPPDQHAVRAQTRYEYTQLSAHYFHGGSSKITGSPVWMRTAERFCINSSYSSGCVGADEVVTRFEYNNDNLLLTGMTVTAPNGTTLRSCFQYDRFGNQIGKTTPNANRTSCN
jgi:YD repeat-containing protein